MLNPPSRGTTAMPRKFNPYDAKAFVFVFLFGFLVATVAATGHGV